MSSRWFRWARRCAYVVVAVCVLVAAGTVALVRSGFVERWARHKVVEQLELRTGARVELGGFHLQVWKLQCELDDLTLHGLEPVDVAPLLHVKRIVVAVRIVSFLHRKIALDELLLDQPEVAIRVDKQGHSNLPHPQITANKRPWNETLFDLEVGKLELTGGSAWFNNRKIPLAVLGNELDFTLRYTTGDQGLPAYVGDLEWKQVSLAARKEVPIRMSLSSKFTLYPSSFTLDDFVCKLPGTELDLRAELPSLSESNWNFHYRGRLSLADLQQIYRDKNIPDGLADFSGQAQVADGNWSGKGHFDARGIAMHNKWFHAKDMRTWGDYEFGKDRLGVSDLQILALGGKIGGRLDLNMKSFEFRTETAMRGVSLHAALDAVNNPSFPVDTMHWDAVMDADTVNTWKLNFHNFRTRGTTQWSPPPAPTPGLIPVTARITYDYFADRRNVAITQSEIRTRNTAIEMDGTLGAHDSTMELRLDVADLHDWDDFINDIRGQDARPVRIGGTVTWKGRILGPIAGPTFSGQLRAQNANFGRYAWNDIVGMLEYSPDSFSLTNATTRWGDTTADLNLQMQFDGDWGFLPESVWSAEVRTTDARVEDLQGLLGTTYPTSGLLSGDFHGSGTREAPVMEGNFALSHFGYKGSQIGRISGLIHLEQNEWSLTDAVLTQGAAQAHGDVIYQPVEKEVKFEVSGHSIALESIPELHNPSFPFAGKLDFDVHGSGPVLAPEAQGHFRVLGLEIGEDVQGNFHGEIEADGRAAHATLNSEMNSGKMDAVIDVQLRGNLPVQGKLSAVNINMDTAIKSGLHLKQVTGHSSVTGEFTMTGELLRPETIEVTAAISTIEFNYELVNVQNDGPVLIVYRKNEVRIEKAHLHGPNTDVQVSGTARFDGNRPLHFTVAGGVNLRFLRGFISNLDAQGAMTANVSIEGTMSNPRITGTASVQDASANYADFPVGLSHVKGNLVFDRSRLLFDRITAQAGGGDLTLFGNVTYGEGPLRFEVNVVTQQVRIRYPAGMSWLLGGKLQLAGTTDAAVLSGQVEVKRVLLSGDADIASFFQNTSLSSPGASATSPFLRNLTFDISGHTGPGAQIEWAGAHVEIDGDVRMRGNWDRPIILGHIHLLGGEMSFRGNNYQLTRGDINFANPFQLDPELNIEATTTISQYQVTINFSGKASRLSMSYRSDPPLPDSDIIALLAIGSTGEESAYRSQTSGSQNYGATALLSEAISSGLGGRIERLFGITHFRVDPFLAGTATESNAAARVTIQQQVTRDMTVTYSSNTSSSQYQLIQVEYSIRRDLSVVFLRDINGTYGFDIKFVRHFQ
ncbi:MAG TPA: translocation/assembly module TamB domain-containing protein [Candidatus Acidoferrum sp.]|nr:translocation/assembly module TamB domain-containing protein [Candidatus Acidoferrum sp.]